MSTEHPFNLAVSMTTRYLTAAMHGRMLKSNGDDLELSAADRLTGWLSDMSDI